MPSERAPVSIPSRGPLARKGRLVPPGFRHRAGQVLRVCGFLAVLTTIGVFAEYQHVSGQVGEQLVSLGDRLMDYEGATSRDETREVVFNGQSLLFSTGRAGDPVSTVLDHFETACAGHDGGLTERYEAARTAQGRAEGHSPVFRYDADNAGVVACLDFGADDVSVTELGERVRQYGQSHDLHDLGDLRYVYAEGNDTNTSTHFVTFWTAGSFRMDAIFPDDGDGGGSDLPDVARPPGSRRTISATETGTNDTVVQYVGSEMTEWELESFYQHQLAASGWAVQDLPEEAEVPGVRVVAARRDDSELYVTLDTDLRGRGQATIVLGQ